MIFAYNKEQVGDVLLVILEDTKDIKRSVERKGKVARVTADETGKTLAWNIFGIPSFVVTQKGQELGRLVNKARKTKEEINAFLSEI